MQKGAEASPSIILFYSFTENLRYLFHVRINVVFLTIKLYSYKISHFAFHTCLLALETN